MRHWLRSLKSNKVKYILMVCVATQLLCTGMYLVNFIQVRRQAAKELASYSDQLAEAISKELLRNNTYLEATVFDNTYRQMFSYQNMEWVNCVSQLQSMYTLCNSQATSDYYFFTTDLETGDFFEAVTVRIPFEAYRDVRTQLLALCAEGGDQVYRLLELSDGSRVIYTIWRYDNFACGCWIPESTFLRSASVIDSSVMYDLVLENGTDGAAIPLVQTDFTFTLRWVESGNQLSISLMTLAQTILSLGMVVGLSVITNMVNQRLLLPVQNLTGVLEKFSQTGRPADGAQWSNAIDDASEILNRLGMQVESLSLKLAEAELEKQKLNLSFRNLQIRPHFLVNNLAMINGMAQVGEVEKIKAVTVRLSNYYRYVLRDAAERVPLHLEITHLQNLFEVTQVCNGKAIHASFLVEESVKDSCIPVLLISTFAENCIKYAQNAFGEVELEIRCQPLPGAAGMLQIQICDNGAGFPPEVISALSCGAQLRQLPGHGVGIDNCIRRLELIYGERAQIIFSNRHIGGAMVEIRLPREVET